MHNIELQDQTRKFKFSEVNDFVDLFFGGRDSQFKISILMDEPPNDSIRGSCACLAGQYDIKLWARNISVHGKEGMRLGGNVTLSRDFIHGTWLVMAHELRHAYQNLYHRGEREFNRGPYMARAAEVDARRFVDENYEAICEYAAVKPLTATPLDELSSVIDMVASHDGAPSEDKLWDHVFEMKGDPDVNFRRVLNGLRSRGISAL